MDWILFSMSVGYGVLISLGLTSIIMKKFKKANNRLMAEIKNLQVKQENDRRFAETLSNEVQKLRTQCFLLKK